MMPVLNVEGLYAGYGRSTVLRDVSLGVDVGDVICLMGRNGAGKTTFLRAIMGVLPKEGTVRLGGEDITKWKGHRINAAGMVWLPQDDAVFPGLTVREHLAIALAGRDLDTGIDAAASLFPILGRRLEQEAQTLSGGERRMLGIAQVLVVQPVVALLDEPTEGVAPVVVEEILPAIAAVAERSAVLLVEQNVDTALAVGTSAYVLENGTIVEEGEITKLHEDGVLEQRLSL
ncbi:MAG: ATP-binding cassette domain-containing protein [Proteobacteria bacterium]|nr:ATP-binding cassette domain-containing protein [Pseudomonadota bacterium]